MDSHKIRFASLLLIASPTGAFSKEPVIQEFSAAPTALAFQSASTAMGEYWAHLSDPTCEKPTYRQTWWLPQSVESRRAVHYPAMAQVACESGIPVDLLDAIIAQESGYNPFAISGAGAMGMMQIMPDTARNLGLSSPWNATTNMRYGARYLRQQIDRFGRVDLALAAYNAGPERRSLRSGYVPAIPETLSYVRAITTNWVRLTQTPAQPSMIARAEAANQAVKASGYREVSLSVYTGMNALNPI